MWKWFRWVLLIIVVVGGGVFSFAAYKGMKHNQELGNKKNEGNGGINELKNASLDKDLPACPSDTSSLFTKPFMEGEKPDFIIPLGNSNESGHVVPVDHVYPSDNISGEIAPVYAPGKLTLIWVENKQVFTSATGEKVMPDFQLNFAPCRGINLAFIHLMKLSDKLSAAMADPVDSNCDTSQKMDYGEINGIQTYYITCHPNFRKVTVEPGELIGYFGYEENDRPFSGFDIGLYDYNKPALGFINPVRYYNDTNHTACFADYYIPELKAKYEAKFANMDPMSKKLIKRTSAPVCGQVMYDKAGTISGDWFKGPATKENITDNDALVLIRDNIQPELAKLSWANVISFTFSPTNSGTVNREFTEVKSDGQIYCYQPPGSEKNTYIDKSGKTVTNETSKFLIQLIDDTHLKAERQSGVCGTNEAFSSPTEFQR